ncbi:hypothetical protein JYB64_11430 [Algoriphagus aestuarii]|nr:hypothetical protein [Algoriphagus aestuarii]
MIFQNRRIFLVYLLSFSLIVLALILFSLNKGFDLTDEGMYMLLLDPLQDNKAGIYHYDLFFKLFYQLTHVEFGIVGSRLLRLFSYILASFACILFWRNFNQNSNLNWELGLILLMALFSGYAFLPPSLSYNSLSVTLACFWLMLISYPKFNQALFFLIGLVLALLVYVKITAAICLLILSLIVLGWQKKLNWKSIFTLPIPFIVLECLFILVLNESAISRMKETMQMMASRSDYEWTLLIKNNLVGLFWIGLVAIPAFVIAKVRDFSSNVFIIIPIAAVGLVFYFTKITDEWSHFFMLASAALIGNSAAKFDWKSKSKNQNLFLLLALILPFALHIGSNVYWLRLGIHYWVFWILALVFMIQSNPALLKLLKAGIPLVTLLLVLNGIWWKPFGTEALWNFNTKWEYKPGKSILLNPEMHAILNDLQSKLIGIPDSQVIAVYRNPGWLYLLNRHSVNSPGIWDKEQLNALYPDFPNGLSAILYFPYQDLPNFHSNDFVEKDYSFPQGSLKLELRK